MRTGSPARRGQRGFALVEMMIALVLGLLLVAAAIQVFLSARGQRRRRGYAGGAGRSGGPAGRRPPAPGFHHHDRIAERTGEGGSTLIVTLILLLVLTVIGVAGMSSTVIQERMAGNIQDSAQVFEAAESALRLCEDRVDADNSEADGASDADEVADFEAGNALDPANAELHLPQPANPLTAKGTTEYQLRCLIEYTGPVDPAAMGCSLSRGRRGPRCPQFEGYRVMSSGARAPAGETDTLRPTVVLQSDMVVWDKD